MNTQGVGIRTDIYATSRCIPVLLRDDGRDTFDGLAVSLQLVRVAIHLQLTDRRTGDRHGTHATDTGQWVGYLIVQDLVKSVRALLRGHGKDQDGDIVRTELEDDRILYVIG